MNTRAVIESAIRLFSVSVIFYICFLIAKPFLTLMVWSAVIAVAIFPFFEWLSRRLKGRSVLAAVLLNLGFFGLLLIPLVRLGNNLARHIGTLKELLQSGDMEFPEPDTSIREWPVIGKRLYDLWSELYLNLENTLMENSEKITQAAAWVLNSLVTLSMDVLLTMAAVVISTVLMLNAKNAYSFFQRFFIRMAGADRGGRYCDGARDTIRNVVKGVVLVALIQATLAGIGFAMIGLPMAGLWAVLVFAVAVMQLPASLITIPLAVYVFTYADTGPAIAFAVYSVLIGFVDNVLKPIFMGRGLQIPMLVILLGSLGGMLMMGVLGLFIGPVIFSLGYELLLLWLGEEA